MMGQAGVDHGRKLPGEDDDVLVGDARLEKGNVFEKVLGLLLDLDFVEPFFDELAPRHLQAARIKLSTLGDAPPVFGRPYKFRHNAPLCPRQHGKSPRSMRIDGGQPRIPGGRCAPLSRRSGSRWVVVDDLYRMNSFRTL